MTALYPPDWRPRRQFPGGRNPRSHALLLLMSVTVGVSDSGRSYPVGVHPSKGSRGTVAQWDAFTSGCDARALLVMTLGGTPDPSLGLSSKKLAHREWLPPLPESTVPAHPAQLELFEVAA